jgi:GTP cyclohydrolase I
MSSASVPKLASELIADIQSLPDHRNIPIDRVGVKGVVHPINILGQDNEVINVLGNFNLTASLPAENKGVHMSRFIEQLSDFKEPLSAQTMPTFLQEMLQRLGASGGTVELSYQMVMKKHAPVTKLPSYMDYKVCLTGDITQEKQSTRIKVQVPLLTLCPCSKEISKYGAHNQRAHVDVTVEANDGIPVDDLIRLIEKQGSSELYSLLKRPDEKSVTERSFENPRFVEDLIRDVACALDDETRVSKYHIKVENFESIHNHSAYAELSRW